MINISVCIITFNRKEYLERAIRSAQHQLEDNDEIVIQDNCSTDGTNEMIKRYTDVNTKIKYFRNESNIGPTLNLGKVIESASGEYIYFLTDDDYLLPDGLKRVRYFFQASKARIFKTAAFCYNEKSKVGTLECSCKSDVGGEKANIEDAVAIYNSAHILTGLCMEKKLFVRSVLEENKNNWYPSMLFVGTAGLEVGYLAEPTNVHTWENVTYWGIDPSQYDELNRGEVAIILYLLKRKYVTYDHYKQIVFEHLKLTPHQDNALIIKELEIRDRRKAAKILRLSKFESRAREFLDRTKKVVKNFMA